jgi:hypothetical protein
VFQGEIRLEFTISRNSDTSGCLRSILAYMYYVLLVTKEYTFILDQEYHTNTLLTSVNYARYK